MGAIPPPPACHPTPNYFFLITSVFVYVCVCVCVYILLLTILFYKITLCPLNNMIDSFKSNATTTKVMFGNSFCFLFSKTYFWKYKEKTIFLYF